MSTNTAASTTTSERAANGRFAKNNPGGPGNPFARHTAALRAALINGVTERDIQEILDVLLLNAKGGHLPTIKVLFSYVIGKPQLAVNPDTLDVQEMQLLQQGALSPEQLETLCRQVPLPFLLQLLHTTQNQNEANAVQSVQGNAAAEKPPEPRAEKAAPPPAPSPNRENGTVSVATAGRAPLPNGENGGPCVTERTQQPSSNGEIRRPPKRAGFDWLDDLRRVCGGRATT